MKTGNTTTILKLNLTLNLIAEYLVNLLNEFEKLKVRGLFFFFGQLPTNFNTKNECSTCG